jgi:tRNA threonylcarbamoyladenosine biosynthesis protein TsaB
MARFASILLDIKADLLPAAEFMLPSAQTAWLTGKAVAPELAQPVYLRNKIALTTQERAAQTKL